MADTEDTEDMAVMDTDIHMDMEDMEDMEDMVVTDIDIHIDTEGIMVTDKVEVIVKIIHKLICEFMEE